MSTSDRYIEEIENMENVYEEWPEYEEYSLPDKIYDCGCELYPSGRIEYCDYHERTELIGYD